MHEHMHEQHMHEQHMHEQHMHGGMRLTAFFLVRGGTRTTYRYVFFLHGKNRADFWS